MTAQYPRPGWGERHPALANAIANAPPVASALLWWGAERDLPIQETGYEGAPNVPDELISSVRCIVQVDDTVVVCTNDVDTHPWPGGRREANETWVETVVREVLEETGWCLEIASLRHVGWLHFEYLKPQQPDWPYPHPDFVQVVYAGRASERQVQRADEWTDTEGWERSSRLMSLPDARRVVADEVARALLDLL